MQYRPDLVPDGSGGAIVFWIDGRDLKRDLYGVRITASGALAPGWPANGIFLASGIGELWRPKGAPDGSGGAIIVWEDDRDFSNTNFNVYAQRVTGDGAIAPGWPPGGLAVCTAPREQRVPRLIPDGIGGAFIVWDDNRDGPDPPLTPRPDIYLQRITASGEIFPGWPADGLAICTTPEQQFDPTIASDGDEGALISWADGRDLDVTGADIYAQHVLPSGELAPGWAVNGIPICTAVGNQIRPQTVSDANGGAVVIWQDARSGPGSGANDGYMDVYAQRIHGDAAIATGWPENGVPLCAAPATQQALSAAPDGQGGAVVAWEDYRSQVLPTNTGSDIYAQRVTGAGVVPPGWPDDGVEVCTVPGFQILPVLAFDGAGGAFVAWVDTRSGTNEDVYAQHVTASGAVAIGWEPGGLPVSIRPTSQPEAAVVSDGLGGAIVAWVDLRNGNKDIYAHKLGIDGPVPTLPSLVSAEADESGIRLRWFAHEARTLEASVYRRTEGTAWEYLGAPEITGPDELRYNDTSVSAGGRYGYRLGYFDGGKESFTDEVWVEAAAPLAFALEGFRPNPAVGLPIVSLTLAKPEPARLEVFDLRGRLVLRRDLSGLGAGRHTVSLDGGVRLAPGVYALRLTQGDRVAHVRGVVLN